MRTKLEETFECLNCGGSDVKRTGGNYVYLKCRGYECSNWEICLEEDVLKSFRRHFKEVVVEEPTSERLYLAELDWEQLNIVWETNEELRKEVFQAAYEEALEKVAGIADEMGDAIQKIEIRGNHVDVYSDNPVSFIQGMAKLDEHYGILEDSDELKKAMELLELFRSSPTRGTISKSLVVVIDQMESDYKAALENYFRYLLEIEDDYAFEEFASGYVHGLYEDSYVVIQYGGLEEVDWTVKNGPPTVEDIQKHLSEETRKRIREEAPWILSDYNY